MLLLECTYLLLFVPLCLATSSSVNDASSSTVGGTVYASAADSNKTTVIVSSTTSTPKILTAAASIVTAKTLGPKHACAQNELRFTYTPCDEKDNRWRVQIPKEPTCDIKIPAEPKPGIKCSFTCVAGQYLNINTQNCQLCPGGRYSVGDGKRFATWKKLPEGFVTKGYDTSRSSGQGVPSETTKDDPCKNSGWVVRGSFLESNGSTCKSVLKYTVDLIKDGNISFTIRSGDESAFFHVWVESLYACKSNDYPDNNDKVDKYYTVTNDWKTHTLYLTKGHNAIYFLASYFANTFDAPSNFDDGGSYESDKEKTVMIKEIVVRGFSSSYDCDICEAGTYSSPGLSYCIPCPVNSYSKAGAQVCVKCSSEEYSPVHSDRCTRRLPCSEKDYFMYWEPCQNGKTRKNFRWKEPHTCSTTQIDAVQLPSAKAEIECPSCNPGQYNNGSSCEFCPKDHFSNGKDVCHLCPPTTRGAPGLFYKFWTRYPISPMHLYCLAKPADGCKTIKGWEIHDEYMDSGSGHADDAELLMYITIPEFTKETSEFKMTFSINCPSEKCRFKIQMIDAGQSVHVIRTYEGHTEKTTFTHVRHSDNPTRYRMVFEKKYIQDKQTFVHSDARVKVYNIEITNVKSGGTAECESCASNGEDCIKCPVGNYIDKGKCKKCPQNTYLINSDNPIGIQSCKTCPYGTISLPGSTNCHSNCQLYGSNLQFYNLSALSGIQVFNGQRRFTTKGYLYYHQFKMSFCNNGKKFKESQCTNNATNKASFAVKAAICRSTIIPDKNGIVSAQSISIGEVLEAVTFSTRKGAQDNSSLIKRSKTDEIIFKFRSNRITEVCNAGTTGIVRLVCDPTQGGRGKIEFNDGKKCHTETCDGCSYAFTIKTKYACPKCTIADYEVINTACVKGIKKTHYVWKQPHVCGDDSIKPSDRDNECTIFEKSILDFKVIILAFFIGGIILGIAVLYLCYRNRSLSYKYHRLVDSSQVLDGELPPSEKCALEDGEEEDEDQIVLQRDKGRSNIIDRLRGIKKRKDFSEFETINLDSVQGYSDDDEI